LPEKSFKKRARDEDLMAKAVGRYTKNYSKTELIFGNFVIILWIALGALSWALFYPLTAFLFFGLAAFLIFYELGKHGCVTCYYCKTCTIGMGKLPELFFKKAGTENVNRRALKLFPFVYLLLSALPIMLIAISFFQETAIYKVVLLAAVVTFSVYSGIIRWQTLVKTTTNEWQRVEPDTGVPTVFKRDET
jgi:hypothetical protein